ncbi:MAG: tRNA pseudouridine(55) synthase TruB [Candidatus Omnitrophota bacterium]|jgi:tRNA pseudouridine55 synthase
MEGIVLINKPDGMTSHDVVTYVRRKFKMRRVGHAGTLDPLATGLLVILLGKATKLFDRFVAFDKAYRATLILGTATTSADTQGKVLEQRPYSHITARQIEDVFKAFIGDIDQVPPMVSAVKMGGRRLYQLARRGIKVERKPRHIHVDSLKMEEFLPPKVKFYLECSKGTYVRQLAEDIGKALGCGACISQIQRTRVGKFGIEDAVNIEDLNERHIRNWED